MTKYFFLSYFIFLSHLSHAQQYAHAGHLLYYDQNVIDSIMGMHNIDSWLIYQVKLVNDSIIYTRNDNDKIMTYLFWMDKDMAYVKMITKDHVYSTFKLGDTRIFNYKYLGKVWVDTVEDNLKIVPPFVHPFDSEVIIYNRYKKKHFFVFGYVNSYTEDIQKHKYRKEFVEMIRHEAITNLKRFKVEKQYSRKPLYCEDNKNDYQNP